MAERRGDPAEVDGSTPSPWTSWLPRWAWREPLGLPECPYLHRWVVQWWFGSIRLHWWHASDDQRHLHDHSFWFLTLVLWGGYTDHNEQGDDHLRAGALRFRRATHRHAVEVDPGGCITLLITGRERREFGFWVNGRFRKRNKYFHMFGHHPCDPPRAG